MDYWNEILVEKSWKKLMQLKLQKSILFLLVVGRFMYHIIHNFQFLSKSFRITQHI